MQSERISAMRPPAVWPWLLLCLSAFSLVISSAAFKPQPVRIPVRAVSVEQHAPMHGVVAIRAERAMRRRAKVRVPARFSPLLAPGVEVYSIRPLGAGRYELIGRVVGAGDGEAPMYSHSNRQEAREPSEILVDIAIPNTGNHGGLSYIGPELLVYARAVDLILLYA